MPSFFIKDGRHFVSIITGPQHVLLGIRFTDQTVEPQVVKLPPVGSCFHGALDEHKVHDAVQGVLAAIRAEAGVNVFAAEIVYVENDTPRYDMYRNAAYRLMEQYLSGGEFRSAA